MNFLTGIRILDLSRLLPGPYATQLLANLGAEVIKIERPPEGDYARAMPPYIALRGDQFEGAVFAQNNRRKKSVALDFDAPRGRAVLLRMCERADVFIESFRPGALARRGLGYENIRAHNPKIIYCSLSGYGQTGPLRDRAGHDLNYVALAGMLLQNAARGNPPHPLPVQVADLAGGMRAALQIVATLFERERTGVGTVLDVALFDAAVEWTQTVLGATYHAENELPARGELSLTGAYPCYNVYATRDDGFIALGALEPIFWKAFCVKVGRADLIDFQFDAEKISDVAEIFKTRTRAEWVEFSHRGDISSRTTRHTHTMRDDMSVDCCMEPLLDVGEMYKHPQVVERNLIQNEMRVPRFGEDTETVLREMGVEEREIREMRKTRIIE